MRCRLCGQAFRAVTPMHLRRIHGFRGPHPIRTYKRRFGLRVAVSAETRRLVTRARRRQVRRHPSQRLWTPSLFRAELRRMVREGEGLAESQVSHALYAAGRRLYGNWDAALRAAGIDRQEHEVARRWSRERLIAAIRDLARRGGRHALAGMAQKDASLYDAARRRFGNWDKAVIAAGCQSQRRPASRRRWTLDVARRWVRQRLREGRSVASADVPLGLLDRVRCDTGEGWGAFLEQLGHRPEGSARRSAWTKAKVRRILRARCNAGLSMSARAVDGDAPRLRAEARRWFGSWRKALSAALGGSGSALRRPAP